MLNNNTMDRKAKVVIKKRAPKNKATRGITRILFALAMLFFVLCQWQTKISYSPARFLASLYRSMISSRL